MEIVTIAKNRLVFEIYKEELDAFIGALNEVCINIEEWEFETRLGIPLQNMYVILEFLKKTATSMHDSIPEKEEIAQSLGDNWLMCPTCQESWEEISKYGMVRCPKCNKKLYDHHLQQGNATYR